MNIKLVNIIKNNTTSKRKQNLNGTGSDFTRGKKLSAYNGGRVAYLERAKASVKMHS
jgi:hypothetical protein